MPTTSTGSPRCCTSSGLDEIVCEKLGINVPPADLKEWNHVVAAKSSPDRTVNIAMVGKYVNLRDAYISLCEALVHAGLRTRTRVNIDYIEATDIEKHGTSALAGMDAILVPGGFGERGIEGKIEAVRYARENGMPYLGICLGMQLAIIEYARNVAGLTGAHSTEFNRASPHPVIALITEWQDQKGTVEARTEGSNLGGTMRLGAQEIRISHGSMAHAVYGADVVRERHRHRFEFNNTYLQRTHERRPAVLRILARRARRNHRTADSTRSSWRASTTPSSARHRVTVIRCSPGFVRAARDHRRGPVAGRGGRMKLCGFEVGPERPFFLIAGPCVVESEGLVLDIAGRMQEITAQLGIPYIFKASYDKANRSSRSSFRGPGIEEGLRILAEVKRQLQLTRADGRARRHADGGGRLRRGRAADARIPVPADEFHPERFQPGQGRQHQERPVPLALGDAQRRRQSALDRQ